MSHIISSTVLESVISAQKNNKGAQFTIKSIPTGREYTYKIGRAEFKNKWYTHIYVETQYQNFIHLGTYFAGNIFKSGNIVTTDSAKAIAFVLNKVEKNNFEYLDKNIELMHAGSCLRCSKTLTDSESIRVGLGPVCVNK